MKISTAKVIRGPAGRATELEWTFERRDPPDWRGCVAMWFIDAPGQSPAWDKYLLSAIHLREIKGTKEATITLPHATHEVLLVALDPVKDPRPTIGGSWSFLRPINLIEQVELPSDDAARELIALGARAIVDGVLWAEAPLSGQTEPWHTSLIRTSAHLRGEEHSP